MIQEFKKNVLRLFEEIVTNKCTDNIPNVNDLLSVLQRKVTCPISIIKDVGYTRIVYYNVTIDVPNDLSSMLIVYNSDYTMTLENLPCSDVHQLSEFILALERDILKWRHIWIAYDLLCKKKMTINEQIRAAMHAMRTQWLSRQDRIDTQTIEQYRIRYYNLKACQLMLDMENPFWENKATEQEILDECCLLHVNPPIEAWCEEFSELVDRCNQLRDEKERRIEEQKRQREKQRHLIRLKKLKLETLIKTIEFHDGFHVSVESHEFDKGSEITICFEIHKKYIPHFIYNEHNDRSIPKIIDAIKRINDIMPDLNNTIKYGTSSSIAEQNYFVEKIYHIISELERCEAIGNRVGTPSFTLQSLLLQSYP